jgi:hypothetical protein
MKQETKIWGWGHHEGVLNGKYGMKDESFITPEEATRQMGLENLYFIVFEEAPQPPYQDYYERFKDFKRVSWSITGADGYTSDKQREAVVDLLKTHPNLEGVVMDDFFKTAPGQWHSPVGQKFPFRIDFEFETPVRLNAVKVTQSDMPIQQGRTSGYSIVLKKNDGDNIVVRGNLADEPGASECLAFTEASVKGLSFVFESYHDVCGIQRCGLKELSLMRNGVEVNAEAGTVSADIKDSKSDPVNLFTPKEQPFASMSIEELKELRDDIDSKVKRDVRWSLVLYTGQISERAKAYFDFFDNIILCVWKADEFGRVEDNIRKLRNILEPSQQISQVVYLFDFGNEKQMSVEDISIQLDTAKRLTDQGICDDIILITQTLCDLNYPAVKYAEKWVHEMRNIK